ncbi:nuclear transport factor 2 family protein [Nocardioides sp. IC4_145]|uniref:nuclear transport factor 2 family protein n=1 Tax=Nocardioides sp. IC4_145 TaxID=2714037 RepID=UPI00140DAC68|nr:nuclear transport factor 2 family protein [Nocardioides sp. IC4_145]NHC22244.1 nuclear transport factor 2 family protein [Nocardioides sp. IC4_145]
MRRLVLLLLSVLLTAALVVPGVLLADGPSPPLRPVAAEAPTARAVLAEWDRRRSAAWAAGDPGALARLYAPGSAAGRHDRAMLERWTRRGLVVEDLRLDLLSVDVLAASVDHLVLRVTDRVTGGRAVGNGLDLRLPQDGPSTRRLTLVRRGGEWVVAKVV